MLTKVRLMLLLFAAVAENPVGSSRIEEALIRLETKVSNLEAKLHSSFEEVSSEVENTKSQTNLPISEDDFTKLVADLQYIKNKYLEIDTKQLTFQSELSKLRTESEENTAEIRKLISAEVTAMKSVAISAITQQQIVNTSISELRSDIKDIKDKQETSNSEITEIKSDLIKAKDELEEPILLQEVSILDISYILAVLEKSISQRRPQIVLPPALKLKAGKECLKYGESTIPCVQSPICAFCVKENFPYNRCDLPENLISKGCHKSEFTDLSDSLEHMVGAINKTRSRSMSSSLVPLCPGTKLNVSVTFQTLNHPVDVYVLITDEYYLNAMKYRGGIDQLLEVVQNISTDFTLGFGISLNKPKPPIGSSETFSFRNVRSLTNKIEDFTASVRRCKKINDGPADHLRPHSQLEAMYQAVACVREIGWRNNTSKILIVATKFPFYEQGDGAVGDITEPFDGLCALNGTGFFANEMTQDYPSESQILQLIKKERVNVVFALHQRIFDNYRELASKLNPPAYIYPSEYSSSHISGALTEIHKQMNSLINLRHTTTSEHIRINYYSNCNTEKEEKTRKCENVENGTSKFKIEIELMECPSDALTRKHFVKIYPNGLPGSAVIPIHLMCNCTF